MRGTRLGAFRRRFVSSAYPALQWGYTYAQQDDQSRLGLPCFSYALDSVLEHRRLP